MGIIWLVAWLLFFSGNVVVVAGISSPPATTPHWIIALNECESEGHGRDRDCWAAKLPPCPSSERYCRDVDDGKVWQGWVKD
jgi:hypothetical protein